MTRRDAFTLSIALAMASLYAYYFTDLFRGRTIQIATQNRYSLKQDALVNPVSFSLDGSYALNEIKVFSVGDLQTNKHPLPAWHLVTSSNSAPIRGFLYGLPIKGMKCAPEKPKPDPLVANGSYRLFVQAGKARGQIDFHPVPGPGASE